MTPEERATAAYPCHPDCAARAFHVKRCIHGMLPGLLTELTHHIRAAEIIARSGGRMEGLEEAARFLENPALAVRDLAAAAKAVRSLVDWTSSLPIAPPREE